MTIAWPAARRAALLASILVAAFVVAWRGVHFDLPDAPLEDESYFVQPAVRVAAGDLDPGWFGHPGINARLTAPPGISPSSAPFIACWRLDIPHLPLVTWPH